MTSTRYEIIPSDDTVERVQRVFADPSVVTLTVASLPKHGTEHTIACAMELAGRGFRVVPHLAARAIESRWALKCILSRLCDAGIDEAFVVSGDAQNPAGIYSTGLELIRDAVEFSPELALDIAGYPEGHPHLSDESMWHHLRERAPFVRAVVTQLCFDVDAVAPYADSLREQGITAHVVAGVPGPVKKTRLLNVATKIGVGPSLNLLQRSSSATDDASDRFDSMAFIARLTATAAGRIAGHHIYTFNDLDALAATLR
ncbi:methylenetetrahydrofolate reductase [Rathayibacter toxicus]|uniref:methylenetetrahydrofolate reductase n=1 Tax=Rathayibacter toxicus TaxID=145458 RepID=UPI001C03B401|nr:methylenetetrahydrofolate reductase [Rathayibacter toxicus]QWL27517.1 methylenetetrahydrofolate reductase [Rathayibacter toxicus]